MNWFQRRNLSWEDDQHALAVAPREGGLRRLWAFLKDLFVQSSRHDLPMLAAALAHYALLSFVPLLLLAAAILGSVLRHAQVHKEAVVLIARFFPNAAATEVISNIFLAMAKERGTVGGFGVVALLWICMRIFITLQRALDRIWNIGLEHRRPWWLQILLAIPTVVVVGVFAWLSFISASVVNSLQQWQLPWLAERLPDLLPLLSGGVSALLSVVLMYMVYRVLPSARVRRRSVLFGAVVTGVLWEAAKYLFTGYVFHVAAISSYYGAMGGFVVVMLWSYVSALIVLFGAEIVAAHAKWIAVTPVMEAREAQAPRGGHPPTSPAATAEPVTE